MEREKGIILNRIFNPMQGDSLKDYYELDIIEHGSAEIFYGNGAMRFRPHAVFLAVSDRSLVIKPANAQEGLSILQIRFHKDMFAPSLGTPPTCMGMRLENAINKDTAASIPKK